MNISKNLENITYYQQKCVKYASTKLQYDIYNLYPNILLYPFINILNLFNVLSVCSGV